MRNIFVIIVVLAVCGSTTVNAQESEFYPLFDGQSLAGWTNRSGKSPGKAWKVEDGAIHLDRSKGRGGDIVSEAEFGAFELVFDWKIAKQGNSGLKYWVQFADKKLSAMEYQLLDEAGHKQGGQALHSTADLYDLAAADPATRHVRPAGVYNRSCIRADYHRLRHWLNGVKVLDVRLDDADWQTAVCRSKFKQIPGYACHRGGKILLQDHGQDVWFKNIWVRPL